jgi:hypothetical protein
MDTNQTKWIKKKVFNRVWVKLEGKNSGFELNIDTNLTYPKLNPNLTQSALTNLKFEKITFILSYICKEN